MANYPASSIIEGFLCPICYKDFKTIANLNFHFEVSHENEDKAIFQSIKEIFTKARNAVLPYRNDDSQERNSNLPEQEIGVTRACTLDFKALRCAFSERYVLETNKLLIRLDKLLLSQPPELVNNPKLNRKDFEKNISPWIPDSFVANCPSCGRSFSLISMRKHHCRLCGVITCSSCSVFLCRELAFKMLAPHNHNLSPSSLQSEECESVCSDDLASNSSSFQKLYESIEEVKALHQKYMKISPSLTRDSSQDGNIPCSLQEAKSIRDKILSLGESIDTLSKEIVSSSSECLRLERCKQLPFLSSKKCSLLQNNIRNFVVSFLKDRLLTLPPLPDRAVYENSRKNFEMEEESLLDAERKTSLQTHKLYKEKYKPFNDVSTLANSLTHANNDLSSGTTYTVSKNLLPSCDTQPQCMQDPLIQQIKIVETFVDQARKNNDVDDIIVFENNLKELKRNYWRIQLGLEDS